MAKDLFSSHSASYAAFRPTYPAALYEFILGQVPVREAAWDCACGNGQVAKDLSGYFSKVYATDISESQIGKAVQKENIIYSVAPAERSGFADGTFDLITVGQALHWFDIPAFFTEARRVAKPGAVVAAWGYGLLSIDDQIDAVVRHFYKDVIGSYWDNERRLIDEEYRSIVFPFERIPAPPFEFSFSWSLEELSGYLTTWSSVQKYIRVNGVNPVEDLMESIRPLWRADRRTVRFPLFMLSGRVS